MRKRLIVIGLFLIMIMIYIGNVSVGTTYYKLSLDRLPESFDALKIVQIADLHDAKFGDNHEKLVDKVRELSPDLIVITGDLIDANRYNLSQSLLLIEQLEGIAPMYYVTGNHEVATNKTKQIKEALVKFGVRVLSNEVVYLTSEDEETIAIGGIEDPLSSTLWDEEAVDLAIAQTFEHVPQEMFKLLLSHRPELFHIYVHHEMDVIFSGHAHGGQFRFPGVGGLLSPGQGWFPKLTSGVHEEKDSNLVISRGLGNSVLPLRLFNRPELVVVTLTKK